MPLEIQRGELTDRLRRFFGITGRVPSQLDETVVPVANLQQLDQPPYRLSERGFSLNDELAAAVGFPSMLVATIPLPGGVVTPTRGAMVVTQIHLANPNAGAAAVTLRISFNQVGTVAGWTLRQQAFDLDRVVNSVGTDVRLPPRLYARNDVAIVGFEMDRWTLTATTGDVMQTLNPPIVCGPGVELIIAGANNAIIRGTFRGVYYPEVML